MAIISFSSFRKEKPSFHSKDWTQQEIADFYRAQRLLAQNGAAIGIDRGLSDENEPWIAFYDLSSQDVFLHIARIDHQCLLFCDPLDLKLSAADVGSLIVKFEQEVKQYLSITSERNRNVVAHPAARIIMSIAAVFLLFKLDSHEAKAQGLEKPGLDDSASRSSDKGQAILARAHNAFSRVFEQVDSPANIAMLASMALIGELAQKDLSLPDLEDLVQSGAIELDTDHFDAGQVFVKVDPAAGHDAAAHMQQAQDYGVSAEAQTQDVKTEIEALHSLVADVKLDDALRAEKTTVSILHLNTSDIKEQTVADSFDDANSFASGGTETTDLLANEDSSKTQQDGDSNDLVLSKQTFDLIEDIFGISYEEFLASDIDVDNQPIIDISDTLDLVSVELLDQVDDHVALVVNTEYHGEHYREVMEHVYDLMGSFDFDYNTETWQILIEQSSAIGQSYDDIGIWTNVNQDGSQVTIIGSLDLIDEAVTMFS